MIDESLNNIIIVDNLGTENDENDPNMIRNKDFGMNEYIRQKSSMRILRQQKKLKKLGKKRSYLTSNKNKPSLDLAKIVNQHRAQMSKEVRLIFQSQSLLTNNLKSLTKERKINDTIVSMLSFIMIILSFLQVTIYIF